LKNHGSHGALTETAFQKKAGTLAKKAYLSQYQNFSMIAL